MAAEFEKLAELAAQGGYKNWAAKLRSDAGLFREAGGPEFFVEPQIEEPTPVATQPEPVFVAPARIEVFTPEALTAEFERLAGRYQELGFHKHKKLRVSAGTLKDTIMGLVEPQPEAFRGRFDIPVVGFGQIPPEDQAKLAGVDYFLGSTNHRDWEEDPKMYKTPKGIYMTWMQDGGKNFKLSVDKVRAGFAPDERGATEVDGIGLYVARPSILKDHQIDLPGTQVGSADAASLRLWNDRPGLRSRFTGSAYPEFGSASCGRNKS